MQHPANKHRLLPPSNPIYNKQRGQNPSVGLLAFNGSQTSHPTTLRHMVLVSKPWPRGLPLKPSYAIRQQEKAPFCTSPIPQHSMHLLPPSGTDPWNVNPPPTPPVNDIASTKSLEELFENRKREREERAREDAEHKEEIAKREERYNKEDKEKARHHTPITVLMWRQHHCATYIQWQVRNRQLRTRTHRSMAKGIQGVMNDKSGPYTTEHCISRLRGFKSDVLHLLELKANNNAVEEWRRTVCTPIIKLLVGRAIQQLSSATTIQRWYQHINNRKCVGLQSMHPLPPSGTDPWTAQPSTRQPQQHTQQPNTQQREEESLEDLTKRMNEEAKTEQKGENDTPSTQQHPMHLDTPSGTDAWKVSPPISYNNTLMGGNKINNTMETYAFVWTKHTPPDATSALAMLVCGDEVHNFATNLSKLVIKQYAEPQPPPEPPPLTRMFYFIFSFPDLALFCIMLPLNNTLQNNGPRQYILDLLFTKMKEYSRFEHDTTDFVRPHGSSFFLHLHVLHFLRFALRATHTIVGG